MTDTHSHSGKVDPVEQLLTDAGHSWRGAFRPPSLDALASRLTSEPAASDATSTSLASPAVAPGARRRRHILAVAAAAVIVAGLALGATVLRGARPSTTPSTVGPTTAVTDGVPSTIDIDGTAWTLGGLRPWGGAVVQSSSSTVVTLDDTALGVGCFPPELRGMVASRSETSLTLVVAEYRPPTAGYAECVAPTVGISQPIDVDLGSAIGHRVLLDGATHSPRPVVRGDEVLPTVTPPATYLGGEVSITGNLPVRSWDRVDGYGSRRLTLSAMSASDAAGAGTVLLSGEINGHVATVTEKQRSDVVQGTDPSIDSGSALEVRWREDPTHAWVLTATGTPNPGLTAAELLAIAETTRWDS